MKPELVKPITTLFGDLGVYGDDADELLTEFGEQFNVDLSALDSTRHFPSEGLPIWVPVYGLVLLFRRGTPEEKRRLEAICVGDLASAAACGEWRYD